MERRLSFGLAADAYQQTRPLYPSADLRFAIEPVVAQVEAENRPLRIVDLAAGTGQVVRSLEQAHQNGKIPSFEITAVEPDEGMRVKIPRTINGSQDVRVLAGDARNMGELEDGEADVVFAGTAFHWFPTDEDLAGIRRVIRPGGVFAPLLQMPDRKDAWVRSYVDGITGGNPAEEFWTSGRQEKALGSFGRREERVTYVGHLIDGNNVDGFVAFASSYGSISSLPEAEKKAKLAQVRTFAENTPEIAAAKKLHIPHVVVATRAIR